MNTLLKSAIAVAAGLLTAQAWAQITFYEDNDFRGRTFSTQQAVGDFRRIGFNDRASSVVVDRGRWEVCDDWAYGGRCVMLQKGNYGSLSDMGLNDRLSSARPASDRRASELPAPAPREAQAYEYRRRPNERVFQAPVTSVHAVMGPPEERCWVERQQVSEPERGDPSVGRGVLGAVIGGVLGHQIGGGRGRDLATVGGAVAGAAIGANSGRDREVTRMRDVRRCDTAGKQVPAYWDVGYKFRGVPHQIQMASAPGRTVEVNGRGEPRQ